MTRALVLGGGGVAGIAWETGVLLGLLESGVDVVSLADVVIGTSAGSTVAAQVTSGTPLAELYRRQASGESARNEIAAEFDPEQMMAEFAPLMSQHAPGPELRAAIGALAIRARTVAEADRRAVIEARLPSHDWPSKPIRIVAVDALTGEDRVFSRSGSVGLVDAVTASCAVPGIWPPVTIAGRRFVDGGVRSSTNLDLAAGHSDVLVLAPVDDLSPLPPDLDQAVQAVERDAAVVTIRPDTATLDAMGMNPLDPATAAPAAAAGRNQGRASADLLAGGWLT